MILTSTLYCLLLVLPADLQPILKDLGNNSCEVRKTAKKAALNLNNEKKKLLISELMKSEDPELTETAKELKLSLNGAITKDKVLTFIQKGNYSKIEIALKINPEAFQHVYNGNMTVVDIAQTLGKQDIVDLFESAGLSKNREKIVICDALVAESDTWESLAVDFNTDQKLIMLINGSKQLIPGSVIKIPLNVIRRQADRGL